MIENDDTYHKYTENLGNPDEPDYVDAEITLREYIESSDILKENKVEAINEISRQNNFCSSSIQFLETVINNGRVKYIPAIYNEFKEFVNAHSGVTTACVTSSVELSTDQKEKVKAILSKKVDGSMEVSYLIKPEILGGLVIECGTEIIDLSLISFVNEAKENVKDYVTEAHESAVNESETLALDAAGLKNKDLHDSEPYKLDHLLKHEQSDQSIAEYITAFESLKSSFEQVEADGGWKSKIPFSFKVDYGVAESEAVSAIEK